MSMIRISSPSDSFWMLTLLSLIPLPSIGRDTGTNYRTGIYYSDPADLPVIQTAVKTEERRYVHPLATEVLPLKNYYPAEGYHQDYLEVHPGGYCHISPVLIHGFRLKSPEELAKEDGNGQ